MTDSKHLPRLFLICLFFTAMCLSPGPARGQDKSAPPLSIDARVDKQVARPGEVITLTITAHYRPGLEIQFPEPGNTIGGLAVTARGEAEPAARQGMLSAGKWYRLRAAQSGSYTIPPLPISYREPNEHRIKQVPTGEIFIEIKDGDGAGEYMEDIVDIKPLERVGFDYRKWAVIAALAALGALAAFIARRFWNNRRREREEKRLNRPPHEEALEKLAALRRRTPRGPEEVKKLYFELSEVFRQYLEQRYRFPATDWTSEEIIAMLSKKYELSFELKKQSKAFFINTDLVKFAEFVPREERIEEEVNRAVRLIEATKEITGEE